MVDFVFWSLRLGGAEIVTLSLLNALSSGGYTCKVYSLHSGSLVPKYNQYITHSIHDGFLLNLLNLFRLFNFKSHPVVSLGLRASLITTLILFFTRRRIIWILHQNHSGVLQQSSFLSVVFLKLFVYLFSRRVYKVIAVSDGVRKDAILRFPSLSDKIITIYNLVSIPKVYSPAPKKSDLELLFVGRLSSEKNLPLLLESVSLLPSDLDWHLTILGSGPEQEFLHNLSSELCINNRVEFVGQVDNVGDYIARSNMILLTSLYEGLPTVLIEALLLDTPGISVDVPSGPSEIYRLGGGRLVAEYKASDFARAIQDEFLSPSIINSKIKDRFSTNNLLERYIDVLFRN